MMQRVKALVTNPDGLSSIPRTYMMETPVSCYLTSPYVI